MRIQKRLSGAELSPLDVLVVEEICIFKSQFPYVLYSAMYVMCCVSMYVFVISLAVVLSLHEIHM